MPPAPSRQVGDRRRCRPRYRRGGEQDIPRPARWSVVDEAPPVAHPLHVATSEVVAAVEASPTSRRAHYDGDDARDSAVLVAIADDAAGAAGVLLTRRSRHLRNHSGEISFPGGRLDSGESPVQAAVREAHEEVGLDPGLVDVVGSLDHLASAVSRSYIVPIVARLPGQIELRPASAEVERVLWVPLGELVRPDTFRAERWGEPPHDRVLYFCELDDETVWGATARILRSLLALLA